MILPHNTIRESYPIIIVRIGLFCQEYPWILTIQIITDEYNQKRKDEIEYSIGVFILLSFIYL